jgi:hypothetical protein
MLATWPMVIGALAAGVIAGLLVPSPKKPVASGSQANLVRTSAEKAEAKTEGSANKTTQSAAEVKPEKQSAEACSQQAWPYYSPTCLDRSATAPGPVRIVNTKPVNSMHALSDEKERKSQAAAPQPAPKRETPQQPQEAATVAPAPEKTQTNRTQENSRQSSNEIKRQIEQERPRQQPRGQARITRVEPPEDWDGGDAPRVLLHSDGTRIYVVPKTRHLRPLNNGYWRSW